MKTMLALEWMGMHNDDTIHHMRVGKQRNPSQIGNEQPVSYTHLPGAGQCAGHRPGAYAGHADGILLAGRIRHIAHRFTDFFLSLIHI